MLLSLKEGVGLTQMRALNYKQEISRFEIHKWIITSYGLRPCIKFYELLEEKLQVDRDGYLIKRKTLTMKAYFLVSFRSIR